MFSILFQMKCAKLAVLCAFLACTTALFLIAAVHAGEAESIRKAVAAVEPRLVRIDTIGGREKVGDEFASEGACTGLLLDGEGFVVTSAFHFLHEPSSILLRFADGSKKVARKICTDRNRMLTLLKVDGLTPAFAAPVVDSLIKTKPAISVGSRCIAVGVALSEEEPNIALGIVSGKDRIWGKAIQTDASVGPNNYGGPLIDVDGKLLGLLVPLSMTSNAIAAGADMYDAGVGMAIPFEDIVDLLPKMKAGGDLESGTTGIGFKENRIFIGEAVIDAIQPDSPAAKAGLEKNDRILGINDTALTSALDVTKILRSCYADETLNIRFRRGNEERETTLKTAKRAKNESEPRP